MLRFRENGIDRMGGSPRAEHVEEVPVVQLEKLSPEKESWQRWAEEIYAIARKKGEDADTRRQVTTFEAENFALGSRATMLAALRAAEAAVLKAKEGAL